MEKSRNISDIWAMKKALLSLVIAALLGVTLMLIPLLLLRTSIEIVDETAPEREAPRSQTFAVTDANMTAKIVGAPRALAAKINWLETTLIMFFGIIPAITISILVKRKLKV